MLWEVTLFSGHVQEFIRKVYVLYIICDLLRENLALPQILNLSSRWFYPYRLFSSKTQIIARVTGGLECIIVKYEALLCYYNDDVSSNSQTGQRNMGTSCYGQLVRASKNTIHKIPVHIRLSFCLQTQCTHTLHSLKKLRSTSTMLFVPQLGNQATDHFNFFHYHTIKHWYTNVWSYLNFHKMRDVPGFHSAGHIYSWKDNVYSLCHLYWKFHWMYTKYTYLTCLFHS